MTNPKLILLLAVIMQLTNVFSSHSQVTVGTNTEPARAALLQLKTQEPNNPTNVTDDKNITSTKGGLLLPRVKLTNTATLEPFIPTTDNDWKNNTAKIKEIHAGLMVYNLTDNTDFKPGIYIWNGSKWEENNASRVESVKVGNGLTYSNSEVKLGGALKQNTEIDQKENSLSITGTGNFTISSPLKIGNDLKITTDAGKDKVLMSDDNGNASWKSLDQLPPTPTAVLSSGKDLTIISSSYVNTDSYIVLPKGKWFVQVTMAVEVKSSTSNNNSYWLRTSFAKAGESIGYNPKLISGRINGTGTSIMRGFIIIEQKDPQPVTYYYWAGESAIMQEIQNNTSGITINSFGGNASPENNIVAFPMI